MLALLIVALAAAMVGTQTYVPKLGLDLAGGTTVTLHPVTQQGNEPPEGSIQQAVQIIRQRVNAFGVSEASVRKSGDNIVVSVPGAGQRELVQQIGQTAQLRFRQVLLVQPTQPAPAPSPSASRPQSPEPERSPGRSPDATETPGAQPTVSGAPGDASGSEEGRSPTANSRAMSAALRQQPSPQPDGRQGGSGQGLSPEQRQQLLEQLQRQQGQGVPRQNTSGIDKDVLEKFKDFRCKPGASRGRLLDANSQVVACNKEGTLKYVLSETKVKGTTVTGANAQPPNPQQGVSNWYVTLEFNGKGTKQFGNLTQRVVNLSPPRDQVAIVLDGVVVSAPQIQSAILGGQAQITGDFTPQEAEDLATILRYGSLPLKFEKSEIRHISATLGADKLRAGLIAAGLGLILVAIYSLLYYRALGIVSVAGLAVAMAISYAAITLLGLTIGYRLSLAGITGLVVAIGITVDSFVVYFERIRDEIRDGRSPRSAVEQAWLRARRTILTADTVSFLAAAVLWVLAVGGVKGFAFTLGLTTLIDILVIFIFTKPILTVLARLRFFGEGHPLSGLDPSRLGARRRIGAGLRGRPAAKEA